MGTEEINLRALAAAQRLRPSARLERAALPGAPMARRAGGGKSVRMARMDAGQFFAGTWTCRRKTPEPARAPGRQDAWRARHRGGLSLSYFSLATQRKVTRAATAARNRFESGRRRARAPLPRPLSHKWEREKVRRPRAN